MAKYPVQSSYTLKSLKKTAFHAPMNRLVKQQCFFMHDNLFIYLINQAYDKCICGSNSTNTTTNNIKMKF